MDKKKKEWLKANWVSIIFHIIPLAVYLIMIYTLLDILSILLSDTDMLMNIFASVTIFGSLTFLSLAYIYIMIWAKESKKYVEDYKKFIGE